MGNIGFQFFSTNNLWVKHYEEWQHRKFFNISTYVHHMIQKA